MTDEAPWLLPSRWSPLSSAEPRFAVRVLHVAVPVRPQQIVALGEGVTVRHNGDGTATVFSEVRE